MVFPALCFPPRQGSLSQQPGLLWFELHWWCSSLKDHQVSLLHLLKVLLKAADYSVNQLWIISFLSIYVTVSIEDCTPKETVFLVQPHCISSDPSWKVLQRLGKIHIYVCMYSYILGFYLLNSLSAPLLTISTMSKADEGKIGFPCFDGWRLRKHHQRLNPFSGTQWDEELWDKSLLCCAVKRSSIGPCRVLNAFLHPCSGTGK